jgi:hypothetical protein
MELEGVGRTCLALGAAAAIMLFALAGCQVGDVVQANVPQAVRQVVPSEPRVSFNEARAVYADWRASVERTAEQFQLELDRKAELVSLLSSLTNDAMLVGVPVLESLPGGGLLTTGLVGLGAWFLRSPGTDKRLAREKEASFNKGLEEGRALTNPAAPLTPREIAA